jgi:hypothetical protein
MFMLGVMFDMATGENKYVVNQHVKSFHDRPSKEFF